MRLHSRHVTSEDTDKFAFVPLPVDAVKILFPTKGSCEWPLRRADSRCDDASLDMGEQALHQDSARHVDVDVCICGTCLHLLPKNSNGVVAKKLPFMMMEIVLGVEKATGDAVLVVAADVASQSWILVLDGGLEAGQHILEVMGKAGAIRSDFARWYRMLPQPLGVGSSAVVHRAISLAAANKGRFAKVPDVVVKIPKTSVRGQLILNEVKQEVAMLSSVQGHPHILKFRGLYYRREACREESGSKELPCWAIVLDHCCGGDAFDFAVKSVVSEVGAGRIIQGIISALAFVHSRQIVHRDVKPENILFQQGGGEQPVLADFGIACHLSNRAEMIRKCGSPGFAAPEVLNGSAYGEKVDVFGAAAALFFLFCVKPPFGGSTWSEMLHNTVHCGVKWGQIPRLHELSTGCKSFMSTLLGKNPEERPNAMEALSHPWLVMAIKGRNPEVASSGEQTSVSTRVARQQATKGEAALHAVDAALVDNCGAIEAHATTHARATQSGRHICRLGSKPFSDSTTSLQSDSSRSLSSSSQESSSDDEDEQGEEEIDARSTTPLSGLARLTSDGSGPPRSTCLKSLLLGQGLSKIIGGRARASAQSPRTPGPANVLRGIACDPRTSSARPAGAARTEEQLPALGMQQPRARSTSQAQKALQRDNAAGVAARRGGRRASNACCQKTSDVGTAETSFPTPAHARPESAQCDAIWAAKTAQELPSFQRRADRGPRRNTAAEGACAVAQSPRQVKQPNNSMAHGKNVCFNVSEAMGAPKTVEALPAFVEEAKHTNRQTSVKTRKNRPLLVGTAGGTLKEHQFMRKVCHNVQDKPETLHNVQQQRWQQQQQQQQLQGVNVCQQENGSDASHDVKVPKPPRTPRGSCFSRGRRPAV